MPKTALTSQILSSCYYDTSTAGENFIPDHLFSYQISGTLTVNDGKSLTSFKPGDFRLAIRNRLVKYQKSPAGNEHYKSLSIVLDQQTLRDFCKEYGHQMSLYHVKKSVILLKPNRHYKIFIDSLQPYLTLSSDNDKQLISLKIKEALLILLKGQPELKDILFDFSEPHKIDLPNFMETNYKYNLNIKRFAYLTGRSVSAFKRDFESIFNTSPGRWLLNRRLKEAFYLIKDKDMAIKQVYLEVGFEDMAHFSRSFKKKFGTAPSRIN
jgi:AraC-like DNA-binding protein